MKRWLYPILLVTVLSGCASGKQELEQAETFRTQVREAQQITFSAEITASYIDRVEEFTLECTFDGEGDMEFRVAEPEEIAGITGKVAGGKGMLTFDETVLAFPLLAEGALAPVSGPWVVMKALRSGELTAVGQEGEKLHLSMDDSYEADALGLELWLEDGAVREAEVSAGGMRVMTLELEEFRMG